MRQYNKNQKMELQLNQKALEIIRDNGLLFGEISDLLKISPLSLPRLLRENHSKLIRTDVLNLIKKYNRGMKDKELLEQKQTLVNDL
jgi:hypothetical protein